MIEAYTGTGGSGKSLDAARRLYWWIKSGKPVIVNFDINRKLFKNSDNCLVIYNKELIPRKLKRFAENYWIKAKKPTKEDEILLVIDECQIIFNSRDYSRPGRADWIDFFTYHRHYGYEIILITPNLRMIDRQVRELIEYNFIHRKVGNYGWKGKVFSGVTGGSLFTSIKVWVPIKAKVGSEFFHAKRFYYRLYDTFQKFDDKQPSPASLGEGAPQVEKGPGEPATAANQKNSGQNVTAVTVAGHYALQGGLKIQSQSLLFLVKSRLCGIFERFLKRHFQEKSRCADSTIQGDKIAAIEGRE